jgi:RsiW-degrading membrane proteinase PrsW (M82 family)
MQNSSLVSIIFLSIFLGFTPVVFYAWLFFLRRKRKFQQGKQPTALLTLMFLGGIAAVIGSFFTERYLIQFLPDEFAYCVSSSPLCQTESGFTILVLAIATFLIVGPIEEGFKFLAVYAISFRSPQFTRIIDGAKFGVAVALGFASAENALYLFSSLRVLDLNTFVSTFLLRFALSSPAHIFYSGLFGYYLGRAAFQKEGRWKSITIGLTLAILTHGLYDFVLFSQVGFYAIFILVFLFLALYLRFRAPENFAIRIPEFMRRRPDDRRRLYAIPIETELTPANRGLGTILAETPDELKPIIPSIKPEYLPDEVPSEFAAEFGPVKPESSVRTEIKVPTGTVPIRAVPSFQKAAQPPRAAKAIGPIPRSRGVSTHGISRESAQSIVDSSVRESKRRRLRLLPPESVQQPA